MVHNTRGVVLRTIKYGETSVVVSIYTELFGIQSYLVNGVRTSAKKSSKANLFQPASILDLEAYHNELKNLQRLKEFKWQYIYKDIFFNVRKNAVALFMVELLQKTLKQPEQNSELYEFIEDAFINLDGSDEVVTANFPLYFALHLGSFFGFRIQDDYSSKNHLLDLAEGNFVDIRPGHSYFLEQDLSELTSNLLKVMQPIELGEVKLNHKLRRQLLDAYLLFYALHIPDFGSLKSLSVLQEILS
ncbi:MAG: DNA repair protein RecO [Bacteroidetes bacterium]|nr:MAG: DNA repair protein RecO [Bacteroidota bacterium]